MQIKKIIDSAVKSLKKNSGTIFAAGACAGVVATAYFSGKAAVIVDHEIDADTDRNLKIKTYVKAYWKTAVSGSATIAAIILSDRIHAGNEAALTATVFAIKTKLDKVSDKITEKYGEDAHDDIYRDIMRDENYGTLGPDLISEGRSKKLYFYDHITGQCIDTTYENLLESLLECNFRLQRDCKAYFDTFLEYNGADTTTDSHDFVWDYDDEIQNNDSSYCGGFTVDFTPSVNDKILNWVRSDKEMTPEDRIDICFIIPPVPEGVYDDRSGLKVHLPWN